MTVIRPNSISGINSITSQGGDIQIFRADGSVSDLTINNITSGVVTATTFSGNISGATGTFTGNLGVGGVLTYEDVTNVDSVGVITARDGIRCTGIVTATAFHGDGSSLTGITGGGGYKNLIINGAMNISQRGTSFTTVASGTYTLDRMRYHENIDSGVVTITQESITDLPTFTKALKINCTTAETGVPAKAGSKFVALTHFLEGQNLQHLAYGTSSAKQITLSFYVKSNITGTFCVSIYKPDQTARNVSLGYTINSANTWERKTLTFPADTGGGGIDNDNGSGLEFYFVLARQQGYQGTASTTWGNNTDARFANLCTATIFENTNDHIMFTGLQLEVGDTATSFEHRSIGDELLHCQRYCFRLGGSIGGDAEVATTLAMAVQSHSTTVKSHIQHPVMMRSNDVNFTISNLTVDDDVDSYVGGRVQSVDSASCRSSATSSTLVFVTSSMTAVRVTRVLVSTAGGYIQGECEI